MTLSGRYSQRQPTDHVPGGEHILEIGDIAVLATAFGLGTILKTLIDRLLDRRKGRIEQEQSAWEQRDAWAKKARRLEEALHEHRTCWHYETGKRFTDMPPWPGRST